MAYNIGAKIELEGEAQYKKALADITAQTKALDSEMKLTQAQFAGMGKSEDSLRAKTEMLNKQIEAQTKKTDLLKGRYEQLAKELGENDSRTQKAKKAYLDSATALQKMKNEADGAGKEVDELGKEEDETTSSTDKMKNAFSTFGKVAGASLAAAATAVTAVAVGVGKAVAKLAEFTQQGAEYADTVNTMSAQTGITTDKLQELQYAAEIVDVNVETVARAMAKNVKSMSSASKGTGEAANAYKALGIAVTNSDGSLRDSQEVFWEAIDALGKMENETQRDAYSMKLFGKGAQELNPLIKAGSARMKELSKEAHDVGYVIGGETLNAFNAFDDNLQKLKATATGLKNNLGTVLLPMLTEVTGSAQTLVGELSKDIQEADGDIEKITDAVKKFVDGASAEISKYAPMVIETVGTIISGLAKIVVENAPTLITTAGEIITQLANGLLTSENIGNITQAILDVLGEIVKTLLSTDTISTLVDTLFNLLNGITDFITDKNNIDMLVSAFVTMIETFASNIKKNAPVIMPKLTKGITDFISAIVDALPSLLSAGSDIIMGLVRGVANSIPVLVKRLPDLLGGVISALVESLPQLLKSSMSILFEILGAVVKSLPSLLFEGIALPFKLLGSLFGINIGDGFDEAVPEQDSRFEDAGTEWAEAADTGFTDKWDDGDNVNEAISDAADDIKKDNKSKFEDAGRTLGSAFAKAMMSQINVALTQLQNVVLPAFNNMTKGGGVVVNNYISGANASPQAIANAINRTLGSAYN